MRTVGGTMTVPSWLLPLPTVTGAGMAGLAWAGARVVLPARWR